MSDKSNHITKIDANDCIDYYYGRTDERTNGVGGWQRGKPMQKGANGHMYGVFIQD
jgi:hypothetical protein